LWNEPNNITSWDWRLDPQWTVFSQMIFEASALCKQHGKRTVLGGMHPIDPLWLETMFQKGVMQHIDVVGIHGFPEVFDHQWEGWAHHIEGIRALLERYQHPAEVWLTEAGFSTWQYDERKQLDEFIKVIELPLQRVFWRGIKDVDLTAADHGTALDARTSFFGMKHHDGKPKLLYRMLEKHKVDNIASVKWITKPQKKISEEKHILITGGAGFVGTNVAQQYLALGKPVTIFDNLSRPGVEENLQWLKDTYGKNVKVEVSDIRNLHAVKKAVQNADQVFHFAAQVAVTTSLVNPQEDFDINAQGTLNILNAMKHMGTPPSLVFTSTNKVYGGLEDVPLKIQQDRYLPIAEDIRKNGIAESRSLDFHSPYGCSKGTADQYVIDYARTFQLPAAVFRMSCIYGPHQFGTEDQGWVAHFVISALKNKKINIYGDGKQVRDLLFVEDLVEAFMLAQTHMGNLAGQAFNIGGGPENAVGVVEVVKYLSNLTGVDAHIEFGDWRPGDQRYYVSDTRKFEKATGWTRKTSVKEGITRLHDWLKEYHESIHQIQLIHNI
ncbi:MAG TPA: GDP-mannose 4,6-dehydratase, partial [Cytophagales bacterium]|nr:GDP-mannose 4,6-dehydratase [Cytophagales bacterium]